VVPRPLDALDALLDLGPVAGELLTERDRRRVLEVRPPRLDDVVELVFLRCERVAKGLQRGEDVFLDGLQ